MKKVFSVKEYKKIGNVSSDWAKDVIGLTHEEFMASSNTGNAYRMSEFIPANLVIPEYLPVLIGQIVEHDYKNMNLYMISVVKEYATYSQFKEACANVSSGIEFGYLMSQLEELESKVIKIQSKAYVLYLKNEKDATLWIGYDDKDGDFCPIASIDNGGRLTALNSMLRVKFYENWREKGMKFDDSIVEWHGKKYKLNSRFSLVCSDVDAGFGRLIYSFSDCITFPDCQDDNILRFKHSLQPILF